MRIVSRIYISFRFIIVRIVKGEARCALGCESGGSGEFPYWPKLHRAEGRVATDEWNNGRDEGVIELDIHY